MSNPNRRYCSFCHKKFKPREKRRYYTIYNYGLNVKFHNKCFEKIKKIARKRKLKIGFTVYLIVLGLIKK